ncbi:hypothetical protein JTB14_000771 [Gonioctena quinquepunctata]|nr:hypothetical protein JTB14_000771 [Gonioctena quinquepunctata]
MYGSNDVNFATEEFERLMHVAVTECVPLASESKNIYPLWFNKGIIDDIKKKDNHRKMYKKTGNQYNQQIFMHLRIKIKQDIKLAHEQYEHLPNLGWNQNEPYNGVEEITMKYFSANNMDLKKFRFDRNMIV